MNLFGRHLPLFLLPLRYQVYLTVRSIHLLPDLVHFVFHSSVFSISLYSCFQQLPFALAILYFPPFAFHVFHQPTEATRPYTLLSLLFFLDYISAGSPPLFRRRCCFCRVSFSLSNRQFQHSFCSLLPPTTPDWSGLTLLVWPPFVVHLLALSATGIPLCPVITFLACIFSPAFLIAVIFYVCPHRIAAASVWNGLFLRACPVVVLNVVHWAHYHTAVRATSELSETEQEDLLQAPMQCYGIRLG